MLNIEANTSKNLTAKNKEQKGNSKKIGKIISKYGMLLILFALSGMLAMLKPQFLTTSNLINIFRQVSVTGTIALGVTFIIIAAGTDLSSGSVVALTGVIVAIVLKKTSSIGLAILVGLGMGGLTGFISGALIAVTGIAPFIATLGMMTAARGAALLLSDGRPITDLSEGFLKIGSGIVLGIPIPVIIFLTMGIVSYILLSKTRFGKYVYAIGGNESAAKVCGINVMKMKMAIYTYAGLMTGIAAIILTSRVGSGNPTAALSYELDAISAAVIGGTSFDGGIGTISGTIIGALIMGVLTNGLSLLGVSPYWQQVIKGGIIVGAVVADAYKNKQKN